MQANGQLHLDFRRKKDGTSYISRQFFKLPLQVFPPNYLDDDGSAFLYLLNPSSGMLENDLFDIRFSLYDRAQVLITTPSSNKIYRTRGEPARQKLTVAVGGDCVLEYLPEHNVPYRDSAYRQWGDFQVEKGGVLFTWDILQPGRVTQGERLDFYLFASENRFTYAGQLLS